MFKKHFLIICNKYLTKKSLKFQSNEAQLHEQNKNFIGNWLKTSIPLRITLLS